MHPKRLQQERRARTNLPGHLRLRVESCVETILGLNEKLGLGKIKPEILEQFGRLRDLLHLVSEDSVDELDISRIEEATNQLMAEIRASLGEKKVTFHDGRMH